MILALITTFALGVVYFISAIPVALIAGAPLWAAALMAWLGYTVGGGIVVGLGAPLRKWLFKKMHLSLELNSKKLLWRIWEKYGLVGMSLIAPVTIGPEVAAILLLALGEKPKKIVGSLALGVLPWVGGFALGIKLGFHVTSWL